MNKKVHIIAEAGTNHNGNIDTAKTLVRVAHEAGADSVKFQIIYPENLYLPGKYDYGHYDIEKVVAMRKAFMLADEDYTSLSNLANELGIKFSASVFCERSTDLLAGLYPPYIKIASTDLNNLQLIRYAASKNIPLIISTGMSTLAQIEKTVSTLENLNVKKFILLHCVSAYPAALKDMNLTFIETLRTAFHCEVGLSDHTQSSIAACMAVSMGVSYIEKHFTLDPSQEGFDHAYAANPETFKAYVSDIRDAEQAMTYTPVKIKSDEAYVKKRARRSLYASKDLKKGHILTASDILIVRPEGPLNSEDFDLIVGKELKENINQYQPFTLKAVNL